MPRGSSYTAPRPGRKVVDETSPTARRRCNIRSLRTAKGILDTTRGRTHHAPESTRSGSVAPVYLGAFLRPGMGRICQPGRFLHGQFSRPTKGAGHHLSHDL